MPVGQYTHPPTAAGARAVGFLTGVAASRLTNTGAAAPPLTSAGRA